MKQQQTNNLKTFIKKLEGVPKIIFEKKYREIIKKELAKKSGVYALYNKDKLYYVGRASGLATRLDQHLKDDHSGKWTHFSVYFTKEKYVHGLESIILSVVPKTKGNKQKSKLGEDKKLRRRIEKAMEEVDKKYREFHPIRQNKKMNANLKKKSKTKTLKFNKNPSIKNPFGKNKRLEGKYKNKTYKARWLKSGLINYNGKKYNSPTGVAKKIVKRNENGLMFWRVKNNRNQWIKLKDCA